MPKEASKLRAAKHLWDAVRFMGLLIGPLPDHKRIFDIHKATRLRVSHVLLFSPPLFLGFEEYLDGVNADRVAHKRSSNAS